MREKSKGMEEGREVVVIQVEENGIRGFVQVFGMEVRMRTRK